MTRDEAIKVIRANWPDARYSMLREALNVAIDALATPAPVAVPPAVVHIDPVYACLSCMRQVPSTEVWQEPRGKSEPVYTHHVAEGHPVVRIVFMEQSVGCPVAAPQADALVARVL